MRDWRDSREYRVWRAIVIRRDKVCAICDSMQSRHAHHVESAVYNAELRYEPSNGICLCAACHTQYHNNFNKSTKVNTTRDNLDNFISLMQYAKNLFRKEV